MTPPQAIERIRDPSPSAFLSDFERPNRPCIIADGASGWAATRLWNAAYLKERLGNVTVQFKRSTRHTHPDFHEATLPKMFARETSSFASFLDQICVGLANERAKRLFTGDEQFLLQRRGGRTTINDSLQPLLADVTMPDLVPPERLYTVWGWFSGPGVRTWLHYDNNGCHNLNGQITGQKSCRLFDPSQLHRMYPFPLGGPNPANNCSQVDIEAPESGRFPAFAEAASYEGTLERGDILFIPAWWFHSFLHLGDLNSNVNFWWKPELPISNEVAARQQLLDWAAAAKPALAEAQTVTAALQALDQAATAPRET